MAAESASRGWESTPGRDGATPARDDDLESLLGRCPSRRPWLELALKQGVAYALAKALLPSGGTIIVAPATAATILQGSTSGAARKALETIGVTLAASCSGSRCSSCSTSPPCQCCSPWR